MSKMYLSVVWHSTADMDHPEVKMPSFAGVAAEKGVARNFARGAAPKYANGEGKAQKVQCLDDNPDYKPGQELFVVPVLEMDNRDHVRRFNLVTTRGYHGVTADQALAERTLAELNRKNHVVKTSPDQLLRVPYLSPLRA